MTPGRSPLPALTSRKLPTGTGTRAATGPDEGGGSERGKAAKGRLGCPIGFSHPRPGAKGCPGRGLFHLLASAWTAGGWQGQTGGWRCSDLPRGSPEFGNLSTGCGEEGGEAEMLAALHPPRAEHPEAIKELQPRWPRAFPGRSAWEQMVKGLIEFGCSGQEAIRRRRKWRRGWGRHSATQEQGAGVRNSGNPLKQAPGCCSRDWAGWLVGANIPAALSPAQGLGQNQ